MSDASHSRMSTATIYLLFSTVASTVSCWYWYVKAMRAEAAMRDIIEALNRRGFTITVESDKP